MGLFGKLFSKPYRNVSIVQARALLDDGAVLVDVRTNQEWNAGHTVASVKGGMYAWQRSGGPVVAKSGRKGEVV